MPCASGSASEFTDGGGQQAQKDNDGVKATYKMFVNRVRGINETTAPALFQYLAESPSD